MFINPFLPVCFVSSLFNGYRNETFSMSKVFEKFYFNDSFMSNFFMVHHSKYDVIKSKTIGSKIAFQYFSYYQEITKFDFKNIRKIYKLEN